jgi:superfamily II DNA or RNA helicase
MSFTPSEKSFAALDSSAHVLLQLFALLGRVKNDVILTLLRATQGFEAPKTLLRAHGIADVLAANGEWFHFEALELKPPVRDLALRALLGAPHLGALEAALHRTLAEQAYYEASIHTHTSLQRLLALMGVTPAQISTRLDVRSYYVRNSSDPKQIAISLPVMLADDLFNRLHLSLQVVQLARRLSVNLRYPREPLAERMQRAESLYQAGRTANFDGADDLLVVHTAMAMLAGAPAPSGINDMPWLVQCWQGFAELSAGQSDAAVAAFEPALKGYRALVGRRTLMGGLLGTLHFLALYVKDDTAAWKSLNPMLKVKLEPTRSVHGEFLTHDLPELRILQNYGQHLLNPATPFTPSLSPELSGVLEFLLVGVLMRWKGATLHGQFTIKLTELAALAEKAGLAWLARQFHAVLSAQPEPGTLVALKMQVAPWQNLLKALEDNAKKPAQARAEVASRLQIYLSRAQGSVHFGVFIGEQRLGKDGTFGAAKIFKSRAGLKNAIERMTDEQDLRIANGVMRAPDFLLSDFADSPAEKRGFWTDLIGHPNVYLLQPKRRGEETIEEFEATPARHVQVAMGQMVLQVKAGIGDSASVEISPKVDLIHETFGVSYQAAGPLNGHLAQLSVIDVSPAQRRVMAMLATGIAIPNSALPQMLELTAKPGSPVKLSMDASAGAKSQASDATLHAVLEPHAAGFSVMLRVRPFGLDAGPYFAPAEGDRRVLGVINGEMRQADRDFRVEADAANALLTQLPALLSALENGGVVTEPEAALDLLSGLQNAQPAPVLAWPKGKSRRVITAGTFAITSKGGRDWLGIEGELEHSEGTIKLSQLIGLLESSRGRYVALDGERFIELSDSLRKRVQSLANFSDARGKIEVPMLAGAVLAQQLGIEHADGVKLASKKMREAFALEAPLPSTLAADLRDYQIAGFRWLMQMAHWGAGACLADDMGLGKTVQALTLLLARASGGPAIVMAPTSVIGNWQREAARFAPTLNVLRFDALDRNAELPALAAFDLLLVSYGLLTTHTESLSKPIFHTIVLDEAQAIKNASTQRAQAACALQGTFRVATTGTPLENHLGELWSLMRFLNPGLLSSQEKFQSRFTNPIERDPSSPAKSVLRQLIAPFLLRRTKAQVLSELPPKTEITLTITPSAQEAQLMQSLRVAAVEKLNTLGSATAEKRFHILAEITRLRRAACHPDLIAPELKIPSAKLAQLLELVAELKENRHRALIFSQFVDYLAIVRSALDSAGLSYQYLDGSTPVKAREAAVSAFQAGASDVFLLSLKAGGVGLNLTAADYVIHLDPWWNPAVEQQASDRAHRIGQTRPVTIYRLVLQGSIEEQILALHGQKRELIDSMLSERETAKPVSADELFALISGP